MFVGTEGSCTVRYVLNLLYYLLPTTYIPRITYTYVIIGNKCKTWVNYGRMKWNGKMYAGRTRTTRRTCTYAMMQWCSMRYAVCAVRRRRRRTAQHFRSARPLRNSLLFPTRWLSCVWEFRNHEFEPHNEPFRPFSRSERTCTFYGEIHGYYNRR